MKTPNERDMRIRDAMLAAGGNVQAAAKALGEKPAALYFNLKTQRQVEWYLKLKGTLWSANERKRVRNARYYRMRLARAAIRCADADAARLAD